jgi:hypothetical protein
VFFENPDVSYDLSLNEYFNPQDGSVYGPVPPPDGSPFAWFWTDPDQPYDIVVPFGAPAAVAQTEAEAVRLRDQLWLEIYGTHAPIPEPATLGLLTAVAVFVFRRVRP